MNAVLMWMRRTWVLGIVFIIIQCLTWFRYQEAYRDWSWTISLVQGATMLGSPFIAGVWPTWFTDSGYGRRAVTLPGPAAPTTSSRT